MEDAAAYHAAVASYLGQLASSGHYPLMSKLVHTASDSAPDAGSSFDLGLKCLLDGVAALLHEVTGT